ncbi:zinc binding protein [Penicillium cinerascens]|uniref:Zinc binding protein n=1 Tax=Penicillium cinerascens TaxID=70096 RepID=A0A9W9JAB7_9EURO|nr:zinc binding protein [Penicillium cinerascens]KAJ5191250.1 zinc binding protein [Penicillium cinerascens]
MSSTHQAAIIPQQGGPLSIVQRPTPTPGPKELLIEVHAVAVNPVDVYQRDMGIFISEYPAVVGSDVSGIVVKSGSSVDTVIPEGTRVTAFASAFYQKGAPNYGALQRYVLVSEEMVTVLPDSFSFTEGSVFPMAALTTWNGWLWAGVPREPSSKGTEGVLVWGGSSSMGAFAVQAAKLSGYTVYATASPQHHEYLKGLGASRVFDYKSEDVLKKIVNASREDGLTFKMGYHATGSQQLSVDVLDALRGEEKVKLAIAPRVDIDVKVPKGVETAFVSAPEDPEERQERLVWIFKTWLQEKLAAGQLVPSPRIQVVEGGLESANKALDELKTGVSGVKLVLEL